MILQLFSYLVPQFDDALHLSVRCAAFRVFVAERQKLHILPHKAIHGGSGATHGVIQLADVQIQSVLVFQRNLAFHVPQHSPAQHEGEYIQRNDHGKYDQQQSKNRGRKQVGPFLHNPRLDSLH